jgi:uncharacterized iron-regulated membrane protein
MPRSIKDTPWKRIRNLLRNIHLWAGLISGLFVVAICFSGTVYVFNTELTEIAAPHLYKVKPGNVDRIPVEILLNKISEKAGGAVTAISVPAEANRTYRFDIKKEGDKSRNGTSYFVNPYSGEITGTSLEEPGTKKFMSTMFSLHRWLLLDKIETPVFQGMTNRELGSKITGWATILFTLGCVTGICIWFPNKIRHWRQGLKIKTSGNRKRIIHDLHNAPAFYTFIFLLLMGITGPQWSFPWYREGMQKTLGTYQAKTQKDSAKKTTAAITGNPENLSALPSLSSMLLTADAQLPYKGDYTIRFPEETEAPVAITKNKLGFFAPAAADKVLIDAASGQIIKTDVFTDKPFNERVAGSIKAIHTGSVYGFFTKFLYFIACLIATTLPITGTLIWLNKLQKKKKKIKVTFAVRDQKITVTDLEDKLIAD